MTPGRARRLVVVGLVAAALAAGAGARAEEPHASDEDVAIAKAHFNTGQAYYEHGRFADAAHEFEEAYRLSGKPALLYNMGKAYDGASDFARALAAYRRFLEAAPPDNADRDFAGGRVRMLTTLVGTIRLDGARAGSSVTVDGKPVGATPLAAPLEVNPGRHAVEVAREQYATFRRAVDVPVGGAAVVTVEQVEAVKVVTVPATAEKPLYKRWWLWAAVGGAVAAAVVITAVVVTRNDSGPPGIQLPGVR